MKIVQLIGSFGDGGLEKHFVELCNGLADLGYEVHAILPSETKCSLNEKVVQHPFKFSKGRFNLFQTIRLVRLINGLSPDVVHTQAGKAASCIMFARRFLSAPTVATVHNQKRTTKPYMGANAVISVSRKAQSFLPKHPNSHVVYNGVAVPDDNNVISLSKLFETDRPIALSIGRLVEAKGFDLLIDAMDGTDLNLVIAGDGPDRESLYNQIDDLGLHDRIKLLGNVENAARLFHQANLCVISSRREGFSYVFAEALVSGIPVISTLVNDAEQILSPSCQVSPLTVEQLQVKLRAFAAQPEPFIEDSRTTIKWGQSELTVKAMVKRNEEILLDVIRN